MKKKNNSLPITLKSIEIENFAGIRHTALKGLPDDAQWIFLTGENGFGKTIILQAIGVALSRPFDSTDGSTIEVLLHKNGSLEKFNHFLSESLLMQPLKVLNELAAFGTSRLEIAHDSSSNEEKGKSGRLYSLFHSDGVLLSIEAEMKIWEQRNPDYFKNLRSTLLKVLEKNIGDIYVENENAKVMYVELDKEGNKLPSVTFEKLASGYRSIVAMVGDLLIRFYKIYPKDTLPEEFAGIVLIDELDVHLHPRLQKKLPCILSKVFPKMQFIASIHSPIPILGAPENAVFLKVFRTKEEGVTVEELDIIRVRSLTPDTLLSSPIFDFDDIIGEHHHRETERLVTEKNYDEVVFKEVLKKRLRQMAKAANLDPNVIPQ